MEEIALELKDLNVSYGGIRAVRNVSLHVKKGEIVALLGPNGAGKTSTLHALARILPSQGTLRFFEHDLAKNRMHEVVALGLILVPEGRKIFGPLSVKENLELGAWLHRKESSAQQTLQEVLSLFPRLKERLQQTAATLSGGEQQMLAMARALMSQPKVLLLDEPSLGLSPKLVNDVYAAIRAIAAGGVTILLVEQNTHLALQTAQRAYVLSAGEMLLEGATENLAAHPELHKAYLGL